MKALYVTADEVNTRFGGGPTIHNELQALRQIAEVDVINPTEGQPFEQDKAALDIYMENYRGKGYSLCHSYAGTWTQLVRQLRADNIQYTATCSAHDVFISQREHKKLQIPFEYPHLINPGLFQNYSEHLRIANCVIAPSPYAKSVLEKQGVSRIQVVPHGFDGPDKVTKLPKNFVLGYIGSAGIDKGLLYLLAAWKSIDFGELHLVGKCCGAAESFCSQNNIKNVVFKGEMQDTAEFYNNISCLIMPSTTEGFGLPVLEAMAYGRSTLASKNCGASFITPYNFEACSIEAIIEAIKEHSKLNLAEIGLAARKVSFNYTSKKQMEGYQKVWQNLPELPPFFGDGKLKVNIGSFVNMFHYGWCNLDSLDLFVFAKENGYKFAQIDIKSQLPFTDRSVDLMFSHHCLEHISWNDANTFIKECKRVMKPGGVFRIVVPSLEKLIETYQAGEMDKHGDNEGVAACSVQSGKFWALLTSGHSMAYDFAAMKALGESVGFMVKEKDYREGESQIISETWEHLPDSLFIEMTA